MKARLVDFGLRLQVGQIVFNRLQIGAHPLQARGKAHALLAQGGKLPLRGGAGRLLFRRLRQVGIERVLRFPGVFLLAARLFADAGNFTSAA